jgi:prepilin-type processing-associated H-X9-DG protein
MNSYAPEDWLKWDRGFRAKYTVGKTVLFVRKTSELVDPGPAARAAFVDGGGYFVPYGPDIRDSWEIGGLNYVHVAPIHHSNGTNLSFADGHVEYWKWTDPDTIAYSWEMVYGYYSRSEEDSPSLKFPKPNGPDYVRFFRAIWGKWPSVVNVNVVH